MLHYILQVVAFQLGFLIIYDVCLRKETFFNWNRVYLLATAVLSILIPFIKIKSIKTILPEAFVIRLPEVIIGNVTEATPINYEVADLAGITIEPEPISIWNILLFSGMCIATLILIFKIMKLVLLASNQPKHWSNNLLIIKLINSNAAFSFFHYVFLGENITVKDRSSILEHEMVHVKQKHTLDLLFFELLRILFWFNPLVYMYQNRIATLHEYLADAKAVKHQNKADYYDNLLAQVFETQQFSFVNPFFKQSLIKKRILMLSKSKSKQINILKYALLLPLVGAMLLYTSSYSQEKLQSAQETTENEYSQLSDDKLKEKLYDEFVEMDDRGSTFMQVNEFAMQNRDKYISSRTDYYRLGAYFEYMSNASLRRKVENNEAVTQEDTELPESMKKMLKRSYSEYLEWKQTDEAKEIWENSSRDGVLRLIVNDFENWTEEEKLKMDQKLDMIERDTYFEKLLIVPMNGQSKMILENPISAKEDKETILTEKIEAVKHQVEIQGNITPEEDEGFELLIKLVSGTDFDMDLVKQVQAYSNRSYQTSLMKAINSVFEQIQVQGDYSDYEEKSLKRLLVLTTIDGINNPALQDVIETVEVPFGVVDEVPVMASCQDLKTNEERKMCLNKGIASHVNTNFNVDLAKQLGLTGKQRINVIFKIDAKGNVIDVKARAPHPRLEDEAKRVINLLPQFKPGKQDGKAVTVPYSLPILFQVAADNKEDKKN